MSASEEPPSEFSGGAVLGLVVASIVWGVIVLALEKCSDDSERMLKIDAIQHGAAEWKVNPDGTTEFKWKEKP